MADTLTRETLRKDHPVGLKFTVIFLKDVKVIIKKLAWIADQEKYEEPRNHGSLIQFYAADKFSAEIKDVVEYTGQTARWLVIDNLPEMQYGGGRVSLFLHLVDNKHILLEPKGAT